MKLVNLIAFVYSFVAMFLLVGLAYFVIVGVVAMVALRPRRSKSCPTLRVAQET